MACQSVTGQILSHAKGNIDMPIQLTSTKPVQHGENMQVPCRQLGQDLQPASLEVGGVSAALGVTMTLLPRHVLADA